MAETKKIATSKTDAKKITTTKTPAKKLATKKAEAKKLTTTKAEPVTRRISTKKTSGNANIYIQYEGKEIDVSKLVSSLESKTNTSKNLDIYIKPEDGKAYFVSDDKTGSIEI